MFSPLLFLLLSYSIYAFYHLGSKDTPLSYTVFNYKGEKAFFSLDSSTQIDEVCCYFGINKNVKFSMEYQNNSSWKELYSHLSASPISFQWHCQELNITKVKNLKLTILSGQMMLNEIRFRYKNKDINFSSKEHLLHDETDVSVSKSYFDGMFFDEIYHGRTAYELMRNIYPIYENTHPYLGKLLIVPGIKVFGMTPFGWRFTNALFSIVLIVIAYYFALQLFREKSYASISAFLMTYSFMHLAEARSGLIDTFGVLFVFTSYWFLYRFVVKQKLHFLLLSGLFFGLASAVKWSAVFASLGYLAIALYLLISHYPLQKQFQGMKLIFYGILSYLFLASTVYFLTFFDIYLQGGDFADILQYQVNMYNYHSQLVSDHAYSSPWWSWPLDLKPMCATRLIENGNFSSLTYFGNPAIFWTGIMALLYLVFIIWTKRNFEAIFIFIAFSSLYFPYVFVGRQMFMYHFYYAVPFLILAIVYVIKDLLSYSQKYAILLPIYLAIVAILFLLFYPVLSGYEVPKSYVDNYLIWFNGWWL